MLSSPNQFHMITPENIIELLEKSLKLYSVDTGL